MTLRFTVLASGSAGNSTLVEANGFGVLIDIGLGVRALTGRLAAARADWDRVQAVLLTHTHSDHWNDSTLAQLQRRQIPLHCHIEHLPSLQRYSQAFAEFERAGLVRPFRTGQELTLGRGMGCRPLAVRHDSGPTFGYRLDVGGDLFGGGYSIGYAADLGCWDAALAEAFTDVDVLAIEFNHDVQMECRSRRQPHLIMRVLGDEGHLSNEQGAALMGAVMQRSQPDKVGHVVQLHLSRECNRPMLAQEAALAMLMHLSRSAEIHTASQETVTPTIEVGKQVRRRRGRVGFARVRGAVAVQPWLPGLEPGSGEIGLAERQTDL